MLTLKNKTILITRPEKQAVEFIIGLEQLGATTIHLPLIRLEAINQPELKSMYNNQNFDWIIFTSYNAVHTFFEVVDPKSIHSKIAVVGTKTGEVLKKYQLTPDFTPSQFTAEVLAKELPILANETVLLPQSASSKNNLVTTLRKREVVVSTINTYQNIPILYKQEKLEEAFKKKIDFITFTSGSTVRSFVALNRPLKNAKVICIGPETAKIAQEHNLNADAVATPHTVEGMITSIVELSFNDTL